MPMTRTFAHRLTDALLALALVVPGLGHQHAPATSTDPALGAYLAAGGALDELCRDGHDMRHDMAQDCLVCTRANAKALPIDTGPSGAAFRIVAAQPSGARHIVAGPHLPRGPPVRGPPVARA